MKKAINTIFEENDYSVFKRLDDNRELYEKRVMKLVASFKEVVINTPVIVNEKMEIIDGQGRFEARKRLGLPITYHIESGLGKDDCIRLNRYNTNWTERDYAISFWRGGNENYGRLIRTMNDTALPLRLVLRLASKQTPSKVNGPFFEGRLIFTKDDEYAVKKTKQYSDDISDALALTKAPTHAFVVAVKIVTETEGYRHDVMVDHCKSKRSSYAYGSTLGEQLKEFERIYNTRVPKNKRLYFSDYMREQGLRIKKYSDDVSTL